MPICPSGHYTNKEVDMAFSRWLLRVMFYILKILV